MNTLLNVKSAYRVTLPLVQLTDRVHLQPWWSTVLHNKLFQGIFKVTVSVGMSLSVIGLLHPYLCPGLKRMRGNNIESSYNDVLILCMFLKVKCLAADWSYRSNTWLAYFSFLTLRSRFSLLNQQFHYSNTFKTFRTVTSYKSPHRCRKMRKKERELSVAVTEESLCLQCVPQGADELAEARAATWLVGPAASEQGVDGGRAELRFRESNSQL